LRQKRKSERISRVSLTMICMMLLQMLLQPFSGFSFAEAAEPIEGFSMFKTADKTEVQVGEEFYYTISFQADSPTAVGKDIKIEDVLPPELQLITPPPGWTTNGQTLTTYVGPSYSFRLESGSSAVHQFKVKVRPTGKASPVTAVNTVVATDLTEPGHRTEASASVIIKADPNPSTPTPTPSPTPVEATYSRWETFKTQFTGYDPSVPIIGGPVTYKVGIKGTAGTNGNGTLKDIQLVDQLPWTLPPDVRVSFPNAAPGGSTRVYDEAANTVTWSVYSLNAGQTFEDTIQVNFPDYYGYALYSPVDQVNTVTLATYSVTGNGTVGGTNSSVTAKFGPPVAAAPSLSKSVQYDFRYPGQWQTYTISGIANVVQNANSALTDVVLVDRVPAEMDFTSVTVPAGLSTLEFETSAAPGVWKPATGINPNGAARAISIGPGVGSPIRLTGDEYLTGLKWTFAKLDAGKTIAPITLEGKVRERNPKTSAPIVHGTTVTNHALLDYKLLDPVNPGTVLQGEQKTASASFKINEPKPWLTVNKTFATNMTYGPLNHVPYTIKVGNDLKATGPYHNPVIYDVLPAEFEYYTDPLIADPAAALAQSYKLVGAPAGLAKPKLEILPPAPASSAYAGRTLVKWYWDEPVKLNPGESFQLTYTAKVKAGTEQNSTGYANDVFITTAQPATFWYNGDPDLDGPVQGSPNDRERWEQVHGAIANPNLPSGSNYGYYVHDQALVPIVKVALVQSTKWNRGDLDPVFVASDNPSYVGAPAVPVLPVDTPVTPPYTEFPRYSVSFEGGTADYKVVIRNSGNTRLGKIDVLDILPYVGDAALRVSGTGLSPRGSQWRPNLAEVPPSGLKTFTSSGATGSKTVQFNLNTFYSKSTDQDKVVNFTNVSGGKTGWVPQADFASSDLSDIRSLYFEISDITGSDGGPGLKAGDYIVLDWKMDAPVGAPKGKIAWNSFAIQAQEINNGLKMLPTAPNKVGFIIDPSDAHLPLGEIGDFVWFDSDRNGLQNERFDGDPQKSGINGITVNLYRDGDEMPFKSSKTGYDGSGNPGYYLFQGLDSGKYRVEFLVPNEYELTLANAEGLDPTHTYGNDSNLTTKRTSSEGLTHYRTDWITLGEAEKNRTIDLGLVEADRPGYPSAKLTKEITGVEQGSAADAPAGKTYATEGNVVKYAITFTNTSSVVLHNIKLADRLDRGQSGFVFTKLVYDGQEAALNGNGHAHPEFISILNNDGIVAEPYVTVRSLDPGKTIRLEGQYTVAAADADGTPLANEATVYYNEAAEPLKASAELPIAAIRVEKTGDAAEVTQAGNAVKYTVKVTNTGSIPLHQVKLTDTKVANLPVIPKLEPGEVFTLDYSYIVSSADMAGSELVNTVTAKPEETVRGSDTHTIPVKGNGGPTPTPTVTPTPTPTATPTPTPTPTATPTPTSTSTPTPTPTVTPTPTPTSEPTSEPTSGTGGTPSPTPTPSGSPDTDIDEETPPLGGPTPTPGVTSSPAPTPTAGVSSSPTPAPTPAASSGSPAPTPSSSPGSGGGDEVILGDDESPLGAPGTGGNTAGSLPVTGEDSRLVWELTGFGLLCLGLLVHRRRRKL
jgi:uncharacterized repeat protein (TIGR01451 family)/LPXTG-motif cell wall-anchored protein